MKQRAWVFVNDEDLDDIEVRILYEDFMVCIFNEGTTVEPYADDSWRETLRCHRDPMMGWEEVPCSW